jgi:hypothetical protein
VSLATIIEAFQHVVDNRVLLLEVRGLLAQNVHKEQHLMSQITDWAASEGANLQTISTTLDGVVTGIAALNKLITDFQNSPGTLSPSDQAALDAIQSQSAALVTQAGAISVSAPVPTPDGTPVNPTPVNPGTEGSRMSNPRY